jgi:hypothetical protein
MDLSYISELRLEDLTFLIELNSNVIELASQGCKLAWMYTHVA